MLNSTKIIGNVEEFYEQDWDRIIHELYSGESGIWRVYYNGWIVGRMNLAHEYDIIDKSGELW